MSNRLLVLNAIKTKNEYKDKLIIPTKRTFGLEIEMDHLSKMRRTQLYKEFVDSEWNVGYDSSLGIDGLEVSTPPMFNTKESFLELKNKSEFLKKCKPSFEFSSLQVSLDSNLSNEQLVYLLKLFSTFEDVIYKYSQGFSHTLRYNALKYASSIKERMNDFLSSHTMDDTIVYSFIASKDYGISFKNNGSFNNMESEINLIEFRTPNGTVDPILWQSYITFFQAIISAIESNNYNDIIDYLYKTSDGENNLDDAIRLSNIIFDNEKDKLLFLKQYIGFNKVSSLILGK